MDSRSEQLPARITVVCPECGRNITTGQSGNNTRCPTARGGCGARVYVPAGQTRPPVTLLCQHCRSVWDTRGAAGNMVRCPKCKAPRRVPAAIRAEPQWAPAPQPSRRRTAETRPRRPAAAPAPAPRRSAWSTPTPIVPRPTGPTLASILQGLTRDATTPPATRRAAPSAPAEPSPSAWPAPAPPYRPAPPARTAAARPGRVTPAPADSFREHHRRDSVTQLVTSMGGPLRIAYDTPHGMCEVMDVSQPRDRQRCRGVASRAVAFWSQLSQDVNAYACPAHAVALAAATEPHPAISATVVGLNI